MPFGWGAPDGLFIGTACRPAAATLIYAVKIESKDACAIFICQRAVNRGAGMIDDVYNEKILGFAGNIPRMPRLETPDASATAHSKLCGSTVTVDLKVADGIVQEPVDASVAAGPDSLSVVKSKNGYKLRDNLLTEQLNKLLDSGQGTRTLVAKVNVTKPSVTTAEVAEKYPTYLTLDRSTYTLTLWKNLNKVKSYTVAVGQQGLETPAGTYSIQDKQVDPVWTVPNSAWAGDMAGEVVPGGTAENPLKARWMGIFDGAGIHGTDDTGSLGSAASHGCVRMSIPDVIDLYDRVDVGTPIYIG